MKKRLVWSMAGPISLISLLTSCPSDGRGELNFNTDPTIFRGVWTAQARADQQTQTAGLRLELMATYRDQYGYDVTGSFKFADDAALEVKGGVQAIGETYLLARPPSMLNLSLKNASSDVGTLNCRWFKNFADKYCTLRLSDGSRAGSYDLLNLVKL